jgi:protein-disulfide isomerase
MSYDRDHNSLFVPPFNQDRLQGMLNASVVLVMYGDYEGSQSADVYRLIKVIQQRLNADFGENYLCFIFRHFPQIQIHPHAQHAAEASEAAAAQGQFWQMLVEYANNLGLDISRFLHDLSKQVHVEAIDKDIESGLQSGVTTAPALFINGIRYHDRWSIDRLMAAIITLSQ